MVLFEDNKNGHSCVKSLPFAIIYCCVSLSQSNVFHIRLINNGEDWNLWCFIGSYWEKVCLDGSVQVECHLWKTLRKKDLVIFPEMIKHQIQLISSGDLFYRYILSKDSAFVLGLVIHDGSQKHSYYGSYQIEIWSVMCFVTFWFLKLESPR